MENKKQQLHVFRMNNFDWWADYNQTDACEGYCKFVRYPPENCLITPIAKLTTKQLEEYVLCNRHDKVVTYVEHLKAMDKPGIFDRKDIEFLLNGK